MIDASPDFPAQLAALTPGGVGHSVDRSPLGGLLLTHAHIGHYVGLVHLGREVIGADHTPVFATAAMVRFLEENAPWEQLALLGHVSLHPVEPEVPVEVGPGVRVTAFRVPHRDEYADTVGYRIDGPGTTVLYVPDTDRWETWDPPLEARLVGVDVALLDGSFHDLTELPGRAIEEVPHPPMTVTMDRLQTRVAAGLRVVFTHLNHSNPAVDPESEASLGLRARGFEVARDGDVIPLAEAEGGPAGSEGENDGWETPQRVFIEGYDDHAMEPFLTRDGRLLLFNNRNDPSENTNLHWAERIDDLHFRYRGEIAGVNTPALEGVPTLDNLGHLFFVSPRSYERTFSVIHGARFADGAASDVHLVPGVSERRPGRVQFDVEVSADGGTLFAVDSDFGPHGPESADLFIALRHGDTWSRDPRSAEVLRLVNTPDHLEYAAAISADERDLYFTRVRAPLTGASVPEIWAASREDREGPFAAPRHIRAIDGFAEAPTVTPDGLALYYHRRDDGRFVLYRIARRKNRPAARGH